MSGPALVDYPWAGRVTPKARFSVPRNGHLLHTITEAVVALDGDRLRYQTRWACGRVTNDAILVADPFGRPHCEPCGVTRTPVVYRLFGEDDRVLYVGCTIRFEARLNDHMKRDWWPEVRTFTAQPYATRDEAEIAEYWALLAENPAYSERPKWPPRALREAIQAGAA